MKQNLFQTSAMDLPISRKKEQLANSCLKFVLEGSCAAGYCPMTLTCLSHHELRRWEDEDVWKMWRCFWFFCFDAPFKTLLSFLLKRDEGEKCWSNGLKNPKMV